MKLSWDVNRMTYLMALRSPTRAPDQGGGAEQRVQA